jgi:membrane protein YqaA with SNARE-associated domain
MAWPYVLVFLGTVLVDVAPLPLPPAFTVMVLLQIVFKLNIWVVIAVGVPGSVVGRYLMGLYAPKLSSRFLRPELNEDVQFLGRRLKATGWKVPAFVFLYSLLPLPTSPLFIAGGMARMKAHLIIPPFLAGKLISDAAAVLLGAQAVVTLEDMMHGLLGWRAITGVILGVLLILALIFIDWRSLLQRRHFTLKLSVWK